ncbi:MAG: hypothetical protein Tsb0014_35650 [Pleurocapsa sp.]
MEIKQKVQALTKEQATYILNKLIEDVQGLVVQFDELSATVNSRDFGVSPEIYEQLKTLINRLLSMFQYVKANCDNLEIQKECDFHIQGITKSFVFFVL